MEFLVVNLITRFQYLLIVLLSLVLLFTVPVHLTIIILLLIIILSLRFDSKYWLLVTILTFTIISRDEFESIRAVIVFLSIIFLFLSFIKEFGLRISKYPQLPWEVITFLFLVVFSLIISVSASSNFMISLISAIRLLVFFIICYFFYSFIHGFDSVLFYIKSLLIISFVISISIYYDFLLEGFSFFLSSGVLARFTGISDNPNFVGLVTMISTILILSFLHLKRFSSKTYKSVFYMLLINNFFIFLIIASRAAVIGTILGSVFLLFFINKKLLRTTLIIGISTIIVLFLITPVRDFLLIVIRLEDFSIREYLWTAGIEIFNDNLLTGIGPSTFRIEFYSYIPSSIITFFNMRFDLSEKNPHPHNFFLLMGAENGILGLLFSLAIFILFFYLGLKLLKLTKNLYSEVYKVTLAFIAVGIGTFFRAFFEVSGIMSYGYISRDLPFWLIFISLIYLYHSQKYRTIKVNI